jgi:hypothetical protein
VIHPTTIDLLRAVEGNIESKVEPGVTDLAAQSALATIKHVVRHVRIRIEREGQVLFDDIAASRSLLPQLREDLAQGDAAAAALAAAIGEGIPREFRPQGRYPDLVSVAEEARFLREMVHQALQILIGQSDHRADDPKYNKLRADVRDYITLQVERQSPLVELAFTGFGPRR